MQSWQQPADDSVSPAQATLSLFATLSAQPGEVSFLLPGLSLRRNGHPSPGFSGFFLVLLLKSKLSITLRFRGAPHPESSTLQYQRHLPLGKGLSGELTVSQHSADTRMMCSCCGPSEQGRKPEVASSSSPFSSSSSSSQREPQGIKGAASSLAWPAR